MSVGVDATSVSVQSYAYSTVTISQNSNNNSFDSNKKYASEGELVNDLYQLEDHYRVQYSATSSETNTVDELLEEITNLFPEFTMVASQPSDVTAGENLLYIDSTNLQKMVDDPSYKAEVYALMKRELAGNDGFHVGGSAWKMTGFVFSLSESNSKEGGIPYAGMCTCAKLDDATVFSGQGSKSTSTICSSLLETTAVKKDMKQAKKNNSSKAKKAVEDEEKDLREEEQTQRIWKKERQNYREYIDSLQDAAKEKGEKAEQYNQELFLKKYEQSILYVNE